MASRVTVWVQRFKDRQTLQLQWIDTQGKRHTKSARTADASEAERLRADLEYELNHGLHTDPGRISWLDFRQAFEAEYLSGQRKNTRTGYAATFDLFERLASPTLLSGVSTRVLSQFLASMRQLPGRKAETVYAASTIAIRLEQMGAALRWAVRQGFLPKAPELPPHSVPKKRPQPVPKELIERLLARIEDVQLRAFVLCGWLAGLRRDEAFNLEWEQSESSPWLDLTRRRIIFPAASVKAVEDQWVPLASELQAALEALRGFPQRGRVFHFLDADGQAINSQAVVIRLTKVARKAGVRLTMRTLRRAFGCWHASRVSAHVLQRLMRHSNIAITMTYYASIDSAVEQAIHGEEHRNAGRDTKPENSSNPAKKCG